LTENLIQIENVTKRYGKLVAVNDLSISIPASQIYGLVGANGAGKSTLIRMIVGISQPDAGQITVNGKDTTKNNAEAKRSLGYLPEELVLYDRLTGREFLLLVAGLKMADKSQVEREIDYFELSEFKDKWVGGYSQGMRKKLGLAAAMIGEPKVLVLDEPLNGLDVEMMRKLRLRLESERERGQAILVSSHVMSFVERICNRVGIIKSGKMVIEGSPIEIRNNSGLQNSPFEDVFFHFTRA
jgi:ABC-2 type transport system ATP-binding protein